MNKLIFVNNIAQEQHIWYNNFNQTSGQGGIK